MPKSVNEENVIGFDALYESMQKAKNGVKWKDSVASFYHRGIERTLVLSKELHDGTYRPIKPRHFVITNPKRREIASIAFRDRVYQRSLNDNVVYPIITRSFIYDNCACQQGKGTDMARDRMKSFLHGHYRKNGTNGYVAQIDIKGYYPNMRHDVTEEMFREKLPGWANDRVEAILHHQYEGDIGYNPGSQLIQIAGISMPDKLDHKIKEDLHIKYYIRYMDDLILIHPDRDYLVECMKVIENELAKIGFKMNEKKTRIYDLKDGIMFLGFTFKLTDTGKVIMIADPSRIKSNRRKYRKLVKKAKNGLISKENVDMSFETWINHLSKGNSYKEIQKLRKFYKELWRDTK